MACFNLDKERNGDLGIQLYDKANSKGYIHEGDNGERRQLSKHVFLSQHHVNIDSSSKTHFWRR